MRIQVRKSSVYFARLRRIRSSRSCSWLERSRAAQRIGVVLDVPEATLLDSVLEEQLASMIETVIEKSRHRLERTCDGPAIFGGRAFEHARLVGIRPEPQTNLPLEILQLPVEALRERIAEEMNRNPALEIQEPDPALPAEPTERDHPDAPADSERTVERIQESWEQLRKLNPNPGVQFAKYSVPTVTPDITVDQADDGTYRDRTSRTPARRD